MVCGSITKDGKDVSDSEGSHTPLLCTLQRRCILWQRKPYTFIMYPTAKMYRMAKEAVHLYYVSYSEDVSYGEGSHTPLLCILQRRCILWRRKPYTFIMYLTVKMYPMVKEAVHLYYVSYAKEAVHLYYVSYSEDASYGEGSCTPLLCTLQWRCILRRRKPYTFIMYPTAKMYPMAKEAVHLYYVSYGEGSRTPLLCILQRRCILWRRKPYTFIMYLTVKMYPMVKEAVHVYYVSYAKEAVHLYYVSYSEDASYGEGSCTPFLCTLQWRCILRRRKPYTFIMYPTAKMYPMAKEAVHLYYVSYGEGSRTPLLCILQRNVSYGEGSRTPLLCILQRRCILWQRKPYTFIMYLTVKMYPKAKEAVHLYYVSNSEDVSYGEGSRTPLLCILWWRKPYTFIMYPTAKCILWWRKPYTFIMYPTAKCILWWRKPYTFIMYPTAKMYRMVKEAVHLYYGPYSEDVSYGEGSRTPLLCTLQRRCILWRRKPYTFIMYPMVKEAVHLYYVSYSEMYPMVKEAVHLYYISNSEDVSYGEGSCTPLLCILQRRCIHWRRKPYTFIMYPTAKMYPMAKEAVHLYYAPYSEDVSYGEGSCTPLLCTLQRRCILWRRKPYTFIMHPTAKMYPMAKEAVHLYYVSYGEGSCTPLLCTLQRRCILWQRKLYTFIMYPTAKMYPMAKEAVHLYYAPYSEDVSYGEGSCTPLLCILWRRKLYSFIMHPSAKMYPMAKEAVHLYYVPYSEDVSYGEGSHTPLLCTLQRRCIPWRRKPYTFIMHPTAKMYPMAKEAVHLYYAPYSKDVSYGEGSRTPLLCTLQRRCILWRREPHTFIMYPTAKMYPMAKEAVHLYYAPYSEDVSYGEGSRTPLLCTLQQRCILWRRKPYTFIMYPTAKMYPMAKGATHLYYAKCNCWSIGTDTTVINFEAKTWHKTTSAIGTTTSAIARTTCAIATSTSAIATYKVP